MQKQMIVPDITLSAETMATEKLNITISADSILFSANIDGAGQQWVISKAGLLQLIQEL